MIIDAHTHTFPQKIAESAIKKMSLMAKTTPYTAGTDSALRESMEKAGIDLSIILPVATNPHQVEKLNSLAISRNEIYKETGLFSLGAMHPDYEYFAKELKRLKENGVTGIKLHPAYQNADLNDIRFLRIIAAAEELGLAVTIHAGLDIGFPDRNYSTVDHICTVIKEINPSKLVLAHMGSWKGWDEVEKTLAGENVFMDTSFSLGAYEPPVGCFVSEEETRLMGAKQFQRIIKKHSAEKILFGTDSPWGDQKRTVEAVKAAVNNEEQLKLIMSENAKKVFEI